MKYKFNVYKQVTTLYKLTANCTADSYSEAVNKFNSNIDKIEAAPNFKEVESCTVYCVDDIVTLRPLYSHSCYKHYPPKKELEDIKLIYQLIDLIYKYIVRVKDPDEDIWDSVTHNGILYDFNLYIIDEGIYRCALYEVDQETMESDYGIFYPYEVILNQ